METLAHRVVSQVEIVEGGGLDGQVHVQVERIDPYTFKEDWRNRQVNEAKSLINRRVGYNGRQFKLDYRVACENIDFEDRKIK